MVVLQNNYNFSKYPSNDYSITFLWAGSLQMITIDYIGGGGVWKKTQNWLPNTWTAPYSFGKWSYLSLGKAKTNKFIMFFCFLSPIVQSSWENFSENANQSHQPLLFHLPGSCECQWGWKSGKISCRRKRDSLVFWRYQWRVQVHQPGGFNSFNSIFSFSFFFFINDYFAGPQLLFLLPQP